MKQISEEGNKFLEQHWDKILKDYKIRAAELNTLLEKDHTEMGLILKIHLIVENYLNQYLIRICPNLEIESARLSFSQKINLISKKDPIMMWLKPGIKELNTVRNKFAHNLNTDIKFNQLIEINKIVKVSRDTSHNSTSKMLYDFAIVSAAFLGKSDMEIVDLFSKALKK